MKVVAIMGSYRRGGTVDAITERLLAGARAEGAETEKVVLVDRDIQYCRNCFACYQDAEAPIGKCVRDDDVREILEKLYDADGVILASPVNLGSVTAVMKTFLERACFTLARPTGSFLWFDNVPQSRVEKRKRAAVVTSAGVIPWYLKFLWDMAERQLAGFATDGLNADLVGTMFIGALIERKPAAQKAPVLQSSELERAFELGRLLAMERLPPLAKTTMRLRTSLEPLALTVSSMLQKHLG